MEGDDDWVSTSPIKLAVPPARRAFTPGRVLSREELRQQRRRGAAPAADHPKESVLDLHASLERLPCDTGKTRQLMLVLAVFFNVSGPA
jgi:hypothetical protein